jgi:ATP synthase protein I
MTDAPSEKPDRRDATRRRAQSSASTLALAMELPFTMVGAVVFAGLLGYFLDKWLHTGPWLTIILGGLGFVAGVREVIRRLPATDSSGGPGDTSGGEPRDGNHTS